MGEERVKGDTPLSTYQPTTSASKGQGGKAGFGEAAATLGSLRPSLPGLAPRGLSLTILCDMTSVPVSCGRGPTPTPLAEGWDDKPLPTPPPEWLDRGFLLPPPDGWDNKLLPSPSPAPPALPAPRTPPALAPHTGLGAELPLTLAPCVNTGVERPPTPASRPYSRAELPPFLPSPRPLALAPCVDMGAKPPPVPAPLLSLEAEPPPVMATRPAPGWSLHQPRHPTLPPLVGPFLRSRARALGGYCQVLAGVL
ncbi:proline-rich receptor-like protein kinase PERK14 [Esox lucius]|uniref:proline-rich receptor-like protein kinase PERK14 n=1 Tax=Esox lucius TaxID=8010 RepID=UPI0014774882|nr:proline-rich receptor-like protein kinase PERK14 [Esox lucius]